MQRALTFLAAVSSAVIGFLGFHGAAVLFIPIMAIFVAPGVYMNVAKTKGGGMVSAFITACMGCAVIYSVGGVLGFLTR